MIDENKFIMSHLCDLAASVKRGRRFAFSSFLNVEQLSCAHNLFGKDSVNYICFGGFEDAERCMIGFGSDDGPDPSDFPIDIVAFDFDNSNLINHRSVLGSLMSLGIKREFIGDIIFKDKCCYIFVENKISDFLLVNFSSVSSIHIKPKIVLEKIEFVKQFEDLCITVPSCRLDCIVGELSNKSRSVSSEMIEGGLVFINSIQCLKKDKIITDGDVISVRRVGKFKVDCVLGYSKKGKIRLNILKYI